MDEGCQLLGWRKSIRALVQVKGIDRRPALPHRDVGRSVGAVPVAEGQTEFAE